MTLCYNTYKLESLPYDIPENIAMQCKMTLGYKQIAQLCKESSL